MAKRSFQATEAGIQQAKSAFDRTGWTQENLAEEVNLKTRQPVWRFFTGRPVERHIFIELCSVLGLNWQDIAEHSSEEPEPQHADGALPEIDTLVRQVRSHRQNKVQNQCGTLQLLNVSRLVKIDDLYIDVNILEEIASQQWLEIADLQNFTPKDFDRFGLGEMSQTQIAGMRAVETYSKLRVLGKPGAGKTTFLQHLAIQCNRGKFAANRVPIFITLRDFADESRAADEFSLLHYIREEFLTSGISDPCVVETLLREGKVLLLLDGLDEVCCQDSKAVVKEIRRFSENYQQNLFVVTCRTAAKALSLNRFTDVEIASFAQAQIAAFGQKWFAVFTKTTPQEGREQAVQFIQKLNSPENLQFRKLATTPLFLHLACWMFQHQHQFPSQRSEFYKQCLDILLTKWDEAKGFEREELYQGFSLPQKLKLLSQIAAITFEQGKYFFEQHIVEEYISDYLRDLPNASITPEELQIESEGVLKAIELQHGLLTERVRGIFSFSDLAFQEYLTARKIVANYNLQATEQPLERLVSRMTDPRWREIFLLTVTMLRSADPFVLLMKRRIDALVAHDPEVQEFLAWTQQKSLATPPVPAAIRAFHHALAHKPHLVPLLALSSALNQGIFLDMVLDNLVQKCTMSSKCSPKGINVGDTDLTHARACVDALSNALIVVIDTSLYQSLQQLKDQLPDPTKDRKSFQAWWQTNALEWADQIRAAVSEHRNPHHQWNFSPEQQQVLQQYYDANQLLLDCLNSHCAVTAAVRQEIEATLLLPQKELEDREWQRG